MHISLQSLRTFQKQSPFSLPMSRRLLKYMYNIQTTATY
uniref:Uncharacterized protein n=1 Tax=Anguilla anguilla TaxID=7936 RepID=A0A0E9RJZ2_ANGAN